VPRVLTATTLALALFIAINALRIDPQKPLAAHVSRDILVTTALVVIVALCVVRFGPPICSIEPFLEKAAPESTDGEKARSGHDEETASVRAAG